MADIVIFALTTRGLEFVTAQEMAALRGVIVLESAYRRVAARCTGSLGRLLGLRTVDDVYLQTGCWTHIDHKRSELSVFAERAAALDLDEALAQVSSIRRVQWPPVFSVTASFIGKRNYTGDEIKTVVAKGINAHYGWKYSPDDRAADLNLRIFIVHENAYVGVRLAAHALHERAYKTAQVAGSLKPSAAAALVMLAEAQHGSRLLDPFCGAGTIVMEAALMGCDAWGGDASPEALKAARTNTQHVRILGWDAHRLPLRAGSFDRVVSNLPWGRQIAVGQPLDSLYQRALLEMRRVLKPGGQAVLLAGRPLAPDADSFTVVRQAEISLFGQTPTVTVLKRRD